jgi:DMSO/TMAO reductase YedYZ heme-binding membrane subunit
MVAAITCLAVLFVRVFRTVWSQVQLLGYPSLSPGYIHSVTESVHRQDGPFLTRIVLVLLGIWIIGVIDAWIRAPRGTPSSLD